MSIFSQHILDHYLPLCMIWLYKVKKLKSGAYDSRFGRIGHLELHIAKVWRAICCNQILTCQIILITLVEFWLAGEISLSLSNNKSGFLDRWQVNLPSRTSIGVEWKWISPELWPEISISKPFLPLSTIPSVRINWKSSRPIESSLVCRYLIRFWFT